VFRIRASRDRSLAPPHEVHDHDDHEDDQEHIEQDLRDPCRRAGYAAEAKKGSEERNDERDQSVVQHLPAGMGPPSGQPPVITVQVTYANELNRFRCVTSRSGG
jgi:hypothetical protein